MCVVCALDVRYVLEDLAMVCDSQHRGAAVEICSRPHEAVRLKRAGVVPRGGAHGICIFFGLYAKRMRSA